jgi:hypothetical protein
MESLKIVVEDDRRNGNQSVEFRDASLPGYEPGSREIELRHQDY